MNAGGTESLITAKNILVATGSEPASIPGVDLDWDRIGTSTEALSYPTVPEHLIVIGAGYIGLEMGSVWKRLGSKVTVLEYMPTFLAGRGCRHRQASGSAPSKSRGSKYDLGSKSPALNPSGGHVVVTYEEKGETPDDRRRPRAWYRPAVAPTPMGSARESTRPGDGQARRACRSTSSTGPTSPGVWAIGDVIPGPMLAHKAEEEGIAAVETMAGQHGHVNYDAIPGIIYTHPEVGSVGKTEQQLKEAGVTPYRKGSFPFMANGRAKAMGETDGLVKILAHEHTDRILGFHVIGAHASDLTAEGAVAMEFSASAEDIARSVHAHPTLSEIVKEAALAVGGRVIHI